MILFQYPNFGLCKTQIFLQTYKYQKVFKHGPMYIYMYMFYMIGR